MTMPMRENITSQGGQITYSGVSVGSTTVGSVGPAGFVRNIYGDTIGTVGVNGSIKDFQGRVLGGLSISGSGGYDFSPNPLAPSPFAEPGRTLLPGLGVPNPLMGIR